MLMFCAMFLLPLRLLASNTKEAVAANEGQESNKPIPYAPLTKTERWNLFVHETFLSPTVYLGALVSAAPTPLHHGPPVWGSEFENYAARVGDNFARTAIANSIEALGADVLGQEVRYIHCDCHGFVHRFGHAMAMSVVTLNGEGRYVPAFASIGGSLGAEFIGDTWMPDNYRTRKRALASAGFDIAFSGLSNVVREFWPGKAHKTN
jgi:hypothetical protein